MLVPPASVCRGGQWCGLSFRSMHWEWDQRRHVMGGGERPALRQLKAHLCALLLDGGRRRDSRGRGRGSCCGTGHALAAAAPRASRAGDAQAGSGKFGDSKGAGAFVVAQVLHYEQCDGWAAGGSRMRMRAFAVQTCESGSSSSPALRG